MPPFLFKRVVHRAEYYRIDGQEEEGAHQQIEESLDHLDERLTLLQEVIFPPRMRRGPFRK